jgi:uncharacterized UPF0146 family protein
MKKEIVKGIEYIYSADWTKELETEDHWRLYWQQQEIIQRYVTEKNTILEIGVGSSFAANYLKSKNFSVTTFDIDKEKKPDIVGNIVECNWTNMKFNHILAFEVFEHIPFEEFKVALENLRSVVENHIIISLPLNVHRLFECEYKIPKFKRNMIRIQIPKNKITTESHFWEVGYDKYSENFVEDMFVDKGYKLVEKLKKSSFVYYVLKNNV